MDVDAIGISFGIGGYLEGRNKSDCWGIIDPLAKQFFYYCLLFMNTMHSMELSVRNIYF